MATISYKKRTWVNDTEPALNAATIISVCLYVEKNSIGGINGGLNGKSNSKT